MPCSPPPTCPHTTSNYRRGDRAYRPAATRYCAASDVRPATAPTLVLTDSFATTESYTRPVLSPASDPGCRLGVPAPQPGRSVRYLRSSRVTVLVTAESQTATKAPTAVVRAFVPAAEGEPQPPFIIRETTTGARSPRLRRLVPGITIVVGRGYFAKRNQLLWVYMSDRRDLETQLGMDLIHYHETHGNYVLLQYKRMRAENGEEWAYRPDEQAVKQLAHERGRR